MVSRFKYRFCNSEVCRRGNYFIDRIAAITCSISKTTLVTLLLCFFSLLLTFGCKEKYEPAVVAVGTNYLVVEGFINAQGITNITLSRTTPLKDTFNVLTESGAAITIVGEDNSINRLSEDTAGQYRSDSVLLSANQKYRLQIKTAEGKEYLSDFLSAKKTPPIDSISWRRENNGVNIYVNSHDELNNRRYYKWTYDDTWEFHSRYAVLTGYVNGDVSARNADEINKMFYCWHYHSSTDILLASTAQLSANIISMIPVASIPDNAEQLSVRYSILVKQVALEKQAYDFYQLMKKNTETTGSVFGPLPTDLSTNIHCVSNPSEKVIGYMTISTEESKRIFISNTDVPGWNFQSECQSIYIESAQAAAAFFNNGLIPYGTKTMGLATLGYFTSTHTCMDCRTRGSNVKPSFW